MADQLSVDPDALDAFAQGMDSARGEFEGASSSVRTWLSSAGSDDLYAALQSFETRWSTGREVLESYFKGLSQVAKDVAAAVRKSDADLAGALKPAPAAPAPPVHLSPRHRVMED